MEPSLATDLILRAKRGSDLLCPDDVVNDMEVQRRAKQQKIERERCVCGDNRCRSLQLRMCAFDPDRTGWMQVPKQKEGALKGIESVRTKLFDDFIRTCHQSVSATTQLDDFTLGINESSGSSAASQSSRSRNSDRSYLSLIHFHPAVVREFISSSAGKQRLFFATTVCAEVGKKAGLTHTNDDGHSYIVCPTEHLDSLEQELNRLDFLCSTFSSSGEENGSSRSSVVSTLSADDSIGGRGISLGGYSLTDSEMNFFEAISEKQPAQIATHLSEAHLQGQQQAARIKELEQQLAESQQEVKLQRNIITQDGIMFLTRRSLCSEAFHTAHPRAANHYFGFESWKETILYIGALFGVARPQIGEDLSVPLSVFEEFLATKMRFRKRLTLQMLSLIFGKGEKHMGRIVRKRAVEWGEAGLDLTILDLSKEYLKADMPTEYLQSASLHHTSALVDGKVYKSNTIRKNSAVSRAQWSSKVEWSGFTTLNYQSPSGLSVEHTPAFLGRTTETAMVKLWGSLVASVPAHDPFAFGEEGTPRATALCDLRITGGGAHLSTHRKGTSRRVKKNQTSQQSSHNAITPAVEEDDDSASDNGGFEDEGDDNAVNDEEQADTVQLRNLFHTLGFVSGADATADATAESDAAGTGNVADAQTSAVVPASNLASDVQSYQAVPAAIQHTPAEETHRADVVADRVETTAETTVTARSTGLLSRALAAFDQRAAQSTAVRRDLRDDQLREHNKYLLEKDTPNASISRKLRQLHRLHALDKLYQRGLLGPNALSYYLHHTREERAALYHYYVDPDRRADAPPQIPLRLGKFPPGSNVLADRGFAYHALYYPNLNGHFTPHFLGGREQFTRAEVSQDMVGCKLRYGSEVAFSRVGLEELLQDEISFDLFPLVHHCVHWAHANINLLQPLRKPSGYDVYVQTMQSAP